MSSYFRTLINPVGLGFIILGALVLIAGIIVLLYLFIFRKNKYRKNIKELDKKFSYLHSLLIGTVAQSIKRLEIISRTNLLYVDTYTTYQRRFRDIRDRHDSNAQSTLNNLKDLLDDKDYRSLKEALPEAIDTIAAYEKIVTTLTTDIIAVIKPEEDARQASLTLKENLRRIKQDYYSKDTELDLVKESFEEIFKLIDDLFTQFDDYLESAQYEDANAILPKIDGILVQVSSALLELPELCTLVTSVVPEKIASLENTYKELTEQDYPLHNLMVGTSLQDMKHRVAVLTTRIKQFNLKGVKDYLNDILSTIDHFFTSFEEEKEARKVFESESDGVYKSVNTIERRFIKLCNNIPAVEQYYAINEEHKSKINEIQIEINKLGALKRSLDTFIHSAIKQPYSELVGKMNELKGASDAVIVEMNEFSSYVLSLKTTTEEAYNSIEDIYKTAKLAEATLSKIAIPNITEKYKAQLDRTYELIDNLNEVLNDTPINVDTVTVLSSELNALSTQILKEGGAIDQDYKMMILAENAIVFMNRARVKTAKIDNALKQAEVLFRNGEFEKSYVLTGDLIKAYNETNQES